MKPAIITKTLAEKNGYQPLTVGYDLPNEQGMFDAVVADLERGDIPYTFVKDNAGRLEIWRSRY